MEYQTYFLIKKINVHVKLELIQGFKILNQIINSKKLTSFSKLKIIEFSLL